MDDAASSDQSNPTGPDDTGSTNKRPSSTTPPQMSFAIVEEAEWTDPTDPYMPPIEPGLRIKAADVKQWVDGLLTHRVIVVRGLDTQVLFAAEHAVADSDPFNRPGCVRCCVRHRALRTPASERKSGERVPAQTEEVLPELSTFWDVRFGAGPRLFIVRAYGSQIAARAFMASLPKHRGDFNDVIHKLKNVDSYVLILTTPSLVDITSDRKDLALFRYVADFVYPRLSAAIPARDLTEELLQHYQAGLWTDPDHVKTAALDEDFYEQVISDIQAERIEKLIVAAEEILALAKQTPEASGLRGERPKKIDVRAAFAVRAAELRDFHRQLGWPAHDEIIAQTMLFVVAHFDRVAAEDFDRVVHVLLGSDTVRAERPTRTLARDAVVTTVQRFTSVALAEIWDEQRHQLVQKWGLRIRVVDGKPTVTGNTSTDASLIRRAFRDKYPFAYAKLWRRCMTAGIVFEPSDDIAKRWTDMLVERIREDGEGFGRVFLRDLLLSERALGPFEGDIGERFDALAHAGGLTWVLGRVSDLLNALWDDGKQETVVAALDQLITWRAPAEVLRLVRRLAPKSFPLASRLKLMQRILHQGGKPHWDDACNLLARWCSDPNEGWEAFRAIAQWLERRGAAETAELVAAAGVLLTVAVRWFGSESTHPLIDLLSRAQRADSSSADVIGALVKWLFHPAFEAACEQNAPRGLSSYWLLPEQIDKATGDDKTLLGETRHAALRLLQNQMAVRLSIPEASLTRAIVVRECQAVIVADWAGAFASASSTIDYGLLLGALATHGSDAARLQVRTTLDAISTTGAWMIEAVQARAWTAMPVREAVATITRRRNVVQELLARWQPAATAALAPSV